MKLQQIRKKKKIIKGLYLFNMLLVVLLIDLGTNKLRSVCDVAEDDYNVCESGGIREARCFSRSNLLTTIVSLFKNFCFL